MKCPTWFFLHISWGLYTVIWLPYVIQSAGQKCPSLVAACYFVSLPWIHIYPSGGFFVEQREIVSHGCKIRTVTYRHPCCNNNRWSPLEIRQCWFLFVSEHPYNSEVSENRPSQQRVSSLEQHTAKSCHLPEHSRNLVKLQDLDSDVGLLLLLHIFLEMIAWNRLPLGTQRWMTTTHFTMGSPVLHGKHVQCHFLNVHLFWFELFLTWSSNGVIGFRSSVSAANRSPPHDGLVCRTDALNVGLGTCKIENYFCSKKEWSAHQMVNWNDVHKMSGHLPENLSHFEKCNTTPLLLPTNFPKAKSNPIRTKFLLSNVVQLALQFYVFRICAEWIPHESDSASRKLFEIPENCSYN